MIYRSGIDAVPTSGIWAAIPADAMLPGENIVQYHSPAVIYKVLSADFIQQCIDGWVFFKNEYTLSNGGQLLTINGMAIDTDTGEVWLRVFVAGQPTRQSTVVIDGKEYQVEEAGVSPMAILAIGTALLAALSVLVISVGYVYAKRVDLQRAIANTGAIAKGTVIPYPNDSGSKDPCTDTGVVAEFQCAVGRASWLVLGAGVGIAVLVVLAIVYREKQA